MTLSIIILCLLLVLAILLIIIGDFSSEHRASGAAEKSESTVNTKRMQTTLLEYTEAEVSDFIRIMKSETKGFEPLTNEILQRIKHKLLEFYGPESGITWSDDQIIASWYWLRTNYSTKNYYKIEKIPKRSLETAGPENILSLSHTYDVGPLAIARRSLKLQGLPDSRVDAYIKNPSSIPDSRQYAMVVKAWEHDFETPTIFKILLEKSREYEIHIENALTASGVLFKTQDDLVKEQMQLYGRPVSTPDVLFLEPVIVLAHHPDGSVTQHRVNWIDAKNYMFLHTEFITKKIKKQSSEYVKHYGPGALMFHYGFVNTLEIPDVMMLSGELTTPPDSGGSEDSGDSSGTITV